MVMELCVIDYFLVVVVIEYEEVGSESVESN